MKIISIDFETYYGKDLGFKTHTTEEYVRDDKFEVIGVGVKVDEEETKWHSGDYETLKKELEEYDFGNSLVLAHNTQFDGAVLHWHFGIRPRGYLDTLCMARAIHGVDVGGSLKVLAERYEIGQKGTEVEDAKGKRRLDFTDEDLASYGEYCRNDVELTWHLFQIFMNKGFPPKELKVINTTLKMFIEPKLELNLPLLEQHLEDVKDKKEALLNACVADKDTLMSNDKFAELLKSLGVDPPTKESPRTKKQAWAFAKTDEEFKQLASHPDPRVQALVSARLGTKTTLEETRTQRFIDIAKRGKLPVPIKYYAAHTGRWGGDDKINLQNLPSRGNNKNKLKKAIVPPDGYVIIDCDSSQIEARTVAWLAEQNDLVDAFEKGEDVYKIMATAIYSKNIEEVTPEERFVGKTTILGCGYGMGAQKFRAQLRTFGADISEAESQNIINIYRTTYPNIVNLWGAAQSCIKNILSNKAGNLGRKGAVEFDPAEKGFLLPSGLWQRYEGLECITDADNKTQYQYKTRKGNIKIYGGKVIENLCQGIARCVIAEQMLKVGIKYPVVLTVHDAVACIAPKEEAKEAQEYVEKCMRWRPEWASDLPLNCESGIGESYGHC
jgi:DNA polymerase